MKRLLFFAAIFIGIGAAYHEDIEQTIATWADDMANASAPSGAGVVGAAGDLGNAVGNTFGQVNNALGR